MSQFFESICVKEGLILNLAAHQLRVDKTHKTFGVLGQSLQLNSIVYALDIPKTGLYKLRISYDLKGNYHTVWTPYQVKQIGNFALVDIQGCRYELKYENRVWINELLAAAGKDEIIMHDAGYIKDTSYANLVFFDGHHWYTPELPLLEGTQRASLIKEEKMLVKPIHLTDLAGFKKFKCINAMLDWETAVEYPMALIANIA